MKKIVSLLLVMLLVLTATACQPAPKQGTQGTGIQTVSETGESKQTTGLPVLSPDDPTTFSVWITTNFSAPAADNKLTKLLKEKLGVTINYEIITPDTADQKIGVMLAGGEYPDLIGTTDLNYRFIMGGALIPLDDYLTEDKANYLFEHVRPYWNRLATDAGDGVKRIYILPNYNRYYGEITGGTHYGASGFWIQKHVLQELGYPSLDNMTLERYFQMIEEYMKKYPQINEYGDLMTRYGENDSMFFYSLKDIGRDWVFEDRSLQQAIVYKDGILIVTTFNKLSQQYERFIFVKPEANQQEIPELENIVVINGLVGGKNVETSIIQPPQEPTSTPAASPDTTSETEQEETQDTNTEQPSESPAPAEDENQKGGE